jgi:hypothetical protein
MFRNAQYKYLNNIVLSQDFKLKEMKLFCENTLIYSIDIKNVIEILISSYKFNYSEIKNLAMNFLLNNFSEVSSKKSFELLEYHPQLLMEVMKMSLSRIEI